MNERETVERLEAELAESQSGWMSLGAVAKHLGVSYATAYRYAVMGEIPSARMPGKRQTIRVNRAAFLKWLAERPPAGVLQTA